MKKPLLALATLTALSAVPALAPANILITEVIPGVSNAADAGDTVELYNDGVSAVDLTGYVLTDVDPGSVESDVLTEGSFAPMALGLPSLEAGEFATVIFSDPAEDPNFRFIETNYGLQIWAPLSSSTHLDNQTEQLLLVDDAATALDFVAWTDTTDVPSSEADTLGDLAAFTPPTFEFVGALGGAAWDAPDAIGDLATYQANAVDVTGLSDVSTFGKVSIQRKSSNGVFQVGSPDGPTDWMATRREDATLGNATDRATSGSDTALFKITDDLAVWVGLLSRSTSPHPRVARDEDNNDFKTPSGPDFTAWTALWNKIIAGDFTGANFDAAALDYELVEFLDTVSATTFYVLRELNIPGDLDFRGQGIYVYNPDPAAKALFLEAPHPLNDADTDDELGLALQQVEPVIGFMAGTHRNNSTTASTCDFGGFRISDVAHHADNFFHRTHRFFTDLYPAAVSISLHGFCCPGDMDHPSVTNDVIMSTGFEDTPNMSDFAQIFADEIDEEAFVADDGMGGDLTTVGIFSVDENELGGTSNLQGRYTNGVAAGDECDTPAVSWNGNFVHLEQDPDVREEPQHIINALLDAEVVAAPVLPVELLGFSVQ